MTITLRPVTSSDKEFCRDVHHSAYRDVVVRQFGRRDEALQDTLFEKEWDSLPLQIIELDDEAVGCFAFELRAEGLCILQIELLPKFQRRGFGTQLLLRQLDEARALRLPVLLGVFKESRARKLYERLGFSVYGETETHYLMRWTDKSAV